MILTCPECKTRYLVNPAQLRPDGRVVRCAKCGHSWKEEAPPPDPDEAQPLTEEASPDEGGVTAPAYERPVRTRPLPRGSNLPAIPEAQKSSDLVGWLALIAFVSLVLGFGYVFRSAITAGWPPSQKLYDTLHIDTKPQPTVLPATGKVKDLLFKNLGAAPRYDNNVLVLTLQGLIANPTDKPIIPTTVTAVAKDDKGADIKKWTFSVDPRPIPAHGSMSFSTELRDAPQETRRVVPIFSTTP